MPLGNAASATAPTRAFLGGTIEPHERAQVSGDRADLEALLADGYLLVTGGQARPRGQARLHRRPGRPGLQDPALGHPFPRPPDWRNGAVIAGNARQKGVPGGKRSAAVNPAPGPAPT